MSKFPLPVTLFLVGAVNLPAQLIPGNLAVVRVGDGSAALTNAAQAVFLEQYTTAGAPVGTPIALPTAASGAQQALTNSGTATSEGLLAASADGRYLTQIGYGAIPGTASIAATTSAAVNRVVARIALDGTVDTSTALNDAFSGNNPRSVISLDGAQFWAAGANGGIRYATFGATTSLSLNTALPTNNRVVGIYGGQLYASASSGAFQGVSAIGSGLPTTAGQTPTLLPGFPTTSGPSAYDFFFADPATLYVADDRTNGSGGIQKWTLSAGTWTLAYTLAPSATVGCRAVTATKSGSVVTLYAVATNNQVVSVTDAGAGSTFASLVTAPTNTAFRGLRIIPTPNVATRVAHGCGPTTIDVSGAATPGGTVTTTLGGVVGVPVIGLGFTVANLPFCTCTLGHDWAITVFAANFPLSVPSLPNLYGLSFGLQGIDAFAPGGCAALQLTLTDTMVVTIR